MAQMIKVFGVKEIRNNMRKACILLGDNVRRGLIRGGLFLERESKKVVPVQFGNLKSSGGSKAVGFGWNTDVIVYYNADYAVYVHENTKALHGEAFNRKYSKQIASAKTSKQKKVWFRRGPKQRSKFLEAPAREKRKQILYIIRASAGKGLGRLGKGFE